MDALAQRLLTGGFDGRESVAEHDSHDRHHLSIAVVGAGELAADPVEPCWQDPVLEWGAVLERTGLPGQHRHVMPRIEHGLVASEGAGMVADDPALLPDLDPVGIGADLTGRPMALAATE